jgi:hypothetical protein
MILRSGSLLGGRPTLSHSFVHYCADWPTLSLHQTEAAPLCGYQRVGGAQDRDLGFNAIRAFRCPKVELQIPPFYGAGGSFKPGVGLTGAVLSLQRVFLRRVLITDEMSASDADKTTLSPSPADS